MTSVQLPSGPRFAEHREMARVYLWEKLMSLASSLAEGEGALRERLEDAASDAALSNAFDELKRQEARGLDPRSEVSQRLRIVVERLHGGEGPPRERVSRLSDADCAETAKLIFELYSAEQRRLGHHDERSNNAPSDPHDPIRDDE